MMSFVPQSPHLTAIFLDIVRKVALALNPTHIIIIIVIKISPQSFNFFFARVCPMQNAKCLPNFIHKYKTN